MKAASKVDKGSIYIGHTEDSAKIYFETKSEALCLHESI
jgi:hypothetical protein